MSPEASIPETAKPKKTQNKTDYKYDLVQIVWDDAHGSSMWEEDNDSPLEPCHIITVGFLVKENSNYVKVADSYAMEGTEYSGTTQIPRGMVKSITVLRKKKATKSD